MKHSAVLTVLALLGACTRNPVSGRPELTVMSAATERRIGAEQAAEVARTIGLVGGLLGGIGELANSALLAPYSRDQEREADRVGQELVAGAGYDPAALSTFLHTLEREEALHRDQARAWSFFATHPPTPERVATTAREAANLTPAVSAPIAASDTDFLAHLDGLPVGPSARDGVFEGETFRHPDLGFAVRLPAGWKTAN